MGFVRTFGETVIRVTAPAFVRAMLWSMFATLIVVVGHTLIEFEHNLLRWDWQGFTPRTVAALVGYALSLPAFAKAGATAESRPRHLLILALPLLVAYEGIDSFAGYDGTEVKPRVPSPVEYRVARTTLMALPVFVLALGFVGGRRRSTVTLTTREMSAPSCRE